jgi:hypothetical protein
VRDEQLPNAASQISESCEPVSNVTAESDEQPRKHSFDRISTDAGVQIERRDEQSQNALRPITLKRDIGEKVTSERSQ